MQTQLKHTGEWDSKLKNGGRNATTALKIDTS